MARYGNSWVEKLIPARGEAEVMARVKGGYGAKNMQRRGGPRYGRRFKNSTKNPEAQFSNGTYGNVNWADGRPNMLWPEGPGDAQVPRRLLSFNADTVASSEAQAQCFLRRINLELAFMATISRVSIAGDNLENNGNERQQIPQPGLAFDTSNTPNGALLNGDPQQASLQGAVSWYEGIPIILFLCYESLAQAESPFDTSFSDDSMLNTNSQRNKRIFWQKLIVPAVTRPVVVNVKKNFPGAGVRLSKGDREIYQVTLGFQGPTHAGVSFSETATEFTGENRWWYFLDKP